MDIDGIFSARGVLASRLPGFEFREEQRRMAWAVLDALSGEKHLIVEAGTGVGKSLAYLVPLCLWLREQDMPRAVVSTHTKALQKQLYEKELPFMKRHLFPGLRYALAFGSENYLCMKRLARTRQQGLFDVEEEDALSTLMEWTRQTATGLRSEVEVPPSMWQKVRREADLCRGKKCEYFGECFYQTARAIERKANIVISNHHLYFAHVASNCNVLPEAHYVVFDEAHEIESIASDYLGAEISDSGLRHLLDAILSARGRGLLMGLHWLSRAEFQRLSAIVDRARQRGEEFFQRLGRLLGDRRSMRLEGDHVLDGDLAGPLASLRNALEELADRAVDEEEQTETRALAHRCGGFGDHLETLLSRERDDFIYWISRNERTVRLSATPYRIADIMRENVFGPLSSAIVTSATLSMGGSFDFVKHRLGLDHAETAIFASPFDFRNQAMLFIPRSMPDPNAPGFAGAVAEQVEEILAASGGNVMVLFTSYQLMNDVYDMVNTEYTIYRQGDLDNFMLLEEFRNNQPSALFGTYTFWQGVDLPGDMLRCVVITRLPFAVPTDPVIEARFEKMRDEGRDPFMEFQVPSAVITFRQGFGRLIRSKRDRGVVAVLDPRILSRPYGRHFLSSLPEVEVVRDLGRAAVLLNQDI